MIRIHNYCVILYLVVSSNVDQPLPVNPPHYHKADRRLRKVLKLLIKPIENKVQSSAPFLSESVHRRKYPPSLHTHSISFYFRELKDVRHLFIRGRKSRKRTLYVKLMLLA